MVSFLFILLSNQFSVSTPQDLPIPVPSLSVSLQASEPVLEDLPLPTSEPIMGNFVPPTLGSVGEISPSCTLGSVQGISLSPSLGSLRENSSSPSLGSVRHRLVATDMNRTLTKVKDRIVGSYLKRWYRFHQC